MKLPEFIQAAKASEISISAAVLLFIYLLSLTAKWATLHITGLIFILLLFFARREFWQSPTVKSYIAITCAWLVPVICAVALQQFSGLATATEWSELLKLVLRMLGIGLGVLLLLQRGWLSLRVVTIVVLAVLAINAMVGIAEWIMMADMEGYAWRAYRAVGLPNNPNPLGTFMAIAIVMAAGFLIKKPGNILIWSMLVLVVAATYASGSRGAILVALIGVALLGFPRNRFALSVLTALLFCAVMLVVYYIQSDIKFSAGDNLRIEAASFAISKILESPLIGWGKEAFLLLPDKPRLNSPHNLLLDMAFCAGLIPVIGWLLSTVWLAWSLEKRSCWLSRLTLALLITAVVAGILEYSLLNSTHFRGVWMLVTVISCWVLYQGGASFAEKK